MDDYDVIDKAISNPSSGQTSPEGVIRQEMRGSSAIIHKEGTPLVTHVPAWFIYNFFVPLWMYLYVLAVCVSAGPVPRVHLVGDAPPKIIFSLLRKSVVIDEYFLESFSD